MAIGVFRVSVSGGTLSGVSAEQAINNFSALFSVPIERTRSLIGRRVVVKRAVDEETARAYVAALEKAGLEAYFEFDSDDSVRSESAAQDWPGGTPASPKPQQQPAAPASHAASPPPIPQSVAPPPLPPSAVAAAMPPPPPPQQSLRYDMDRSRSAVPQVGNTDLFLNSVGVGHLAPLFRSHGVTSEMLCDLTDQDLQSIGVASLGERKCILGAVRQYQEDQTAQQAIAINKEMTRTGKSVSKGFLITYGVLAGLVGLLGIAANEGIGAGLGLGLAAFVVLWIYFLPTQIAFRNQVDLRWAILVGNIFFGGTLLGWIIVLVLAKRLVSGKAAATIGVVGAIAGRI